MIDTQDWLRDSIWRVRHRWNRLSVYLNHWVSYKQRFAMKKMIEAYDEIEEYLWYLPDISLDEDIQE